MRYIKTIILIAFLCFFSNVKAQLSTNEKPVSFDSKMELTIISKSALPVVTMPRLNMSEIEKEDKEDEEYDMPPRFGYSHIVDYNLDNSGVWYELPNGDKLWQLNVICPGAMSVNFCYNKFWLPEGGKFFVYSKDKKHSIGAFTSRNNKGSKDNIRGFATGLVYGSDVVLEYYHPKGVTAEAIISIEYIVHGYRYINVADSVYGGFGQSGPCMVNVNCSEGQNWQNEKKAVAMIVVEGNRCCTGSLINTTDLEQKPYLLTADHCLGPDAHQQGNFFYDAESSPNLDSYTFYWNYETPGCDNVNIEPGYFSTSGATVIANYMYSDFALLRLSEDPKDISGYTPYYLGWDRSGQPGSPGVCIHHPKGDVKKISTVLSTPTSSSWYESWGLNSHWEVGWKTTSHGHGMTQPGSSGSPLLNAMHRVIGQLHGSNSDDCNNHSATSFYGKLSTSWIDQTNSNSIYRRLNCWLDSLNTGQTTMEGLLIIPTTQTMNSSQQLRSNIRITSNGQLTIQSNVSFNGNCRIIVESGGQLIVNAGTLSNVDVLLKPGSYLQILNGGIIYTHSGFKAQEGAIVDIQYGQIL